MRNCPTIEARGREGKKVATNVKKDDNLNKRSFYALRIGGSKLIDDDE